MKRNICKFVPVRSMLHLKTTKYICEREDKLNKAVTFSSTAMFLVINGNGIYKSKREYEIKCGDLFFVFPGTVFSVCSVDSLEYIYINFEGNRADDLLSRFYITEDNCVFHDYVNLVPLWHTCLVRCDEENIDLASESVLLYTFSCLKVSRNPSDELIRRVIQYVEEHYTDPALSLEVIANELFYNPKYISSLFKKKMNIGFSRYLHDLRIKNALFLMEQGVTSVRNIAMLSGYTDSLYFSKLFKKQLGVSPVAYIAELSGKNASDSV